MILSRIWHNEGGILGRLFRDDESRIGVTLEHAFQFKDTPAGLWEPVIPKGVYTCVRGPHRLAHMTQDFETFEVTGIARHSGLIFHWGNWNTDSKGCILLGDALSNSPAGPMITDSRRTFAKFMAGLSGTDTFTLTIE